MNIFADRTFVGPRRRGDDLAGQVGFTLIEILVALAIIGAIGALALPPLGEMYDRIAFSLAREDVEREIADLGPRARHEGRNLELISKSPLVAMPRGWTLTTDNPIEFRYDGLCLGGRVTVDSGDQKVRYRLDPPFCHPVPLT